MGQGSSTDGLFLIYILKGESMEHSNLDYFRDDELVGKRVRVKYSDKYKRYKVKGRCGTITKCYSYIAVELDGLTNEYSATGEFYFYKKHLEIIEDKKMEETTMAINTNIITNYLNTALIHFLDDRDSSRTYTYANYVADLQVGDLCVVMSAQHGMGVARVVDIVQENDTPLAREIVCKIDTADYDARVERRKKAAELKAKMQERARQLQDIVLYQTLAKDDPEMAQLLSDFTNLGIV